jgi:hypothetical protein
VRKDALKPLSMAKDFKVEHHQCVICMGRDNEAKKEGSPSFPHPDGMLESAVTKP